ncbi:hypothetical protein J2Z72_000101 [Peptostreptococcus canis]|nr:hypothetical protein [Peptostreptococcus canis]
MGIKYLSMDKKNRVLLSIIVLLVVIILNDIPEGHDFIIGLLFGISITKLVFLNK